MKFLKKAGIVLAVIIAILLVIPLMVRSEFTLVRETVIHRTKADVFSYLTFLKNHENFSVWAQADKQAARTSRGTDGQVGFVTSWVSQNRFVGSGEQEIRKIIPGERIDYELRLFKPIKATNQSFMKLENFGAEQTKVMWGFQGKIAYPFNAILLVVKPEKALGHALDEGLEKMKSVLETKTPPKK